MVLGVEVVGGGVVVDWEGEEGLGVMVRVNIGWVSGVIHSCQQYCSALLHLIAG